MAKQVILWLCLFGVTNLNSIADITTNDPFTSIAATIVLKNKEQHIYVADYQNAIYEKIRSTFYHGKPPEGEEQKVKDEVWDVIVKNTMLLLVYQNEGNYSFDTSGIERELAEYDEKFSDDPRWETMKDKVLAQMERRLIRDKVAILMKEKFDSAVTVSQSESRRYYMKHPQLFTEPERVRASIILFSVDPSSPTSVWELAMKRAEEIKSQINNYDQFKSSAKKYSSDITAEQGGDMGFLHQGQMGGDAKEIIKKLAIGEISAPVILLEGIAIFMVNERLGATHHTFEEVSKRASQLARRDKIEKSWLQYINQLKKDAKITTDIAIDNPTAG